MGRAENELLQTDEVLSLVGRVRLDLQNFSACGRETDDEGSNRRENKVGPTAAAPLVQNLFASFLWNVYSQSSL